MRTLNNSEVDVVAGAGLIIKGNISDNAGVVDIGIGVSGNGKNGGNGVVVNGHPQGNGVTWPSNIFSRWPFS